MTSVFGAELAAAIEELSIPVDGPAIAEVFGLVDRLEAKLSEALGAFDAAGLWDLDAATSLTAWLRDHAGLTSRQAARSSSGARRLSALAGTASAWRAGLLCGGQIAVILACVDTDTEPLYIAQQDQLVGALSGLSVNNTAKVMAHWKAHAGAVVDKPEPTEPARHLHLSETMGGRWALDGDLDALSGAVVSTALRLANHDDLSSESHHSPSEHRAEALVELCRFFLDHQHQRAGGRHRPHLNVVVDLDDLEAGRGGHLVEGGAIDPAGIGALLCDCALHRLIIAGRSTILDYGTATRTIPAPLWNTLVIRDQHCRFPECDRPAMWCDGHHLQWVEHGGPTRPDNLVLMCRRHHRRLHHQDWQAKLRPDGILEVTDPDGRVRTSAPPGSLTFDAA